jgi:hypothetical protein
MKKALFLYAVIIFSSCNILRYEERLERQGKIKCGWYGKMKAEERRKVFPFNQTEKVVLISYPDYEIDENNILVRAADYVITPWGEKLPPKNNDYIEEAQIAKITKPILDTLKLFNRIYSVYEMITLNENQIDSLSHLILNYKRNRKLKYETTSETCCYKPRNAIVFLNKKGEPILNYEICFECNRSKIYPNNPLYEACSKIELFKDFFKQCAVHYGVDSLKQIK